MQTALFWFRRDLRLEDNVGLFHALKSGLPVIPVFVFDTDILNQLQDKADKRVDLIYQRLLVLQETLHKHNVGLVVKCGTPAQIIPKLCETYHVKEVFCNEDYEPHAMARDKEIKHLLAIKNIAFRTYKDQVVFAKNEVLKPDGKPYTIYTPYAKKWKAMLLEHAFEPVSSELLLQNFIHDLPSIMPTLTEIGFQPTGICWEQPYLEPHILKNYAETRNFPSMQDGTTKLSVHLRFGTIGIRKMVKMAMQADEVFLSELIWREFFMMILVHFPHVIQYAFKPNYEAIPWRNNEAEFLKWCAGNTGYPIVDAGMRELNATGLMHNRVRMVTASFLVKHLLIDWRWGEAYFAQKLLDYDLSANNGNWQWAAGCGCDAAPYFRVFNPTEQTKRFDSQLTYIRKWVPEINELTYPKPMIEHAFARNRVLETYKKALGSLI
ncbi:MAG: deoxyribodipyrimidine photolyase [Porphyromonadaceae bacterium CG2_30_38_12]|nr:MAG: deoxyribodipyrimidine photolyase [Porphyromonadaceae bacterium CG2_30_38_12]